MRRGGTLPFIRRDGLSDEALRRSVFVSTRPRGADGGSAHTSPSLPPLSRSLTLRQRHDEEAAAERDAGMRGQQ